VCLIGNRVSSRWAIVASAWILVLLAAGWFGGTLGALGCDENLRPGTTRDHVCTSLGLRDFGGVEWIALASAPSVVFALGLSALPQVRRRPNILGSALVGGVFALYSVILVLVTR
jgi:hypothetical protein